MVRDFFLFFQVFFGLCIPIRRRRSTNDKDGWIITGGDEGGGDEGGGAP
jgi:hypothetical protein